MRKRRKIEATTMSTTMKTETGIEKRERERKTKKLRERESKETTQQ